MRQSEFCKTSDFFWGPNTVSPFSLYNDASFSPISPTGGNDT